MNPGHSVAIVEFSKQLRNRAFHKIWASLSNHAKKLWDFATDVFCIWVIQHLYEQ